MLVHHYIKIINQNLGKVNLLHTYLGNWDCKLKMIIYPDQNKFEIFVTVHVETMNAFMLKCLRAF